MKNQLLFSAFILLHSCDLAFNSSSSIDSSESSSQNSSSVESFFSENESVSISESEYFPDPYENVDKEEFYRNYTPADSYLDSYYRSEHYLLSGVIEENEVLPPTSQNQPMEDDKYVFNITYQYGDDGYSYDILDMNGNAVKTIYKGAAYCAIDEVAAYLFAFGDVPANYVEGTRVSPSNSPWGEYLRLNHSYFSADVNRYPYQPSMPDSDIKTYYEVDFGSDGGYGNSVYNNGQNISRGTCRFVYTRYYKNGGHIENASERYVFYTYNHYNDFQQYLNYQGGWGKRFGNETGGGSRNNMTDLYKTEYPEVAYRLF